MYSLKRTAHVLNSYYWIIDLIKLIYEHIDFYIDCL